MSIQRTPGRPVVPTATTSPTTPGPTPAPTPTPAPAPAPSPATVKAAEKLLKLAGFSPGKIDGKQSTATTQAIKDFQASWGMAATGELDKKTMDKLRHTGERIKKHKGDEFVGVGQRSSSIKVLERRLRKLGYDTGKADGTFDRDTQKAVLAFRKDQKELDDKAGYLAKGSRAVLRREARELEHAPERRRLAPSSRQTRMDRQTALAVGKTHADGTVGVGVGSKGNSIKNIQAHLKAAGFDPQHVNGQFDERTEGALKAFQRKSGLEVTGRVDTQTWKKLQKSYILTKSKASPAQDVGERSRAVLHSEKLLKQLGFNPGKVDGLFDRNTLRASQAFERKHTGGKDDGAIGAAQLNKMEKLVKQQGVTLGQLRRIMPDLPLSKAKAYLPHLNKAMAEAKITTEKRKAMFLAQLAHESVQLRYFEEIASGAAYEGRTDLGNIHPGDGRRFKGRGPIQLTGRNNYRAAGRALGLNLEDHPRMVSRPSVGFRTSAWFWNSRDLNRFADQGNFREVTRRINGGYNGYEDRLRYYRRALQVL